MSPWLHLLPPPRAPPGRRMQTFGGAFVFGELEAVQRRHCRTGHLGATAAHNVVFAVTLAPRCRTPAPCAFLRPSSTLAGPPQRTMAPRSSHWPPPRAPPGRRTQTFGGAVVLGGRSEVQSRRCRASHRGATTSCSPFLAVAEAPRNTSPPPCVLSRPSSNRAGPRWRTTATRWSRQPPRCDEGSQPQLQHCQGPARPRAASLHLPAPSIGRLRPAQAHGGERQPRGATTAAPQVCQGPGQPPSTNPHPPSALFHPRRPTETNDSGAVVVSATAVQRRREAPATWSPKPALGSPRPSPRTSPLHPPRPFARATDTRTAMQHRAAARGRLDAARHQPWRHLLPPPRAPPGRRTPPFGGTFAFGGRRVFQPLRCRASHRGVTGARCPLLAVAEAPRSLNPPNSTSLHPPSTVSFARRPTTMNDGAPVVTPASTLRLALPQAVERKRSARLFSKVEGHA
ncbi:hypothetical protein SCP_1900010, partial [Sparassis crispa]